MSLSFAKSSDTGDPPPSPEAWLLGRGDPPPPEVLRSLGLAAHAYGVLPAEHPYRAAVRVDYLKSLARHQAVKREIVPLLTAWRQVGIEALLFKGFQLAEFVYADTGGRMYLDVDVAVHPESASRAVEVACGIGWKIEVDLLGPEVEHGHAAAVLLSPTGSFLLDLHRWILHAPLPEAGAQRRITRAVWDRSREVEWEGTRVRLPDPIDALLVGLVLQRSWSGDRWGLKPHDLLDFRVLEQQAGASREALRARARQLGCTRTLDRFLSRCDPSGSRLVLSRPGARERIANDLAVISERGPLGRLQSGLAWVRRDPRALLDGLRELPGVYSLHRALRRERDLQALVRRITPADVPPCPGPEERRRRTVRGIRLGARLLRSSRSGDRLLQALATYVSLRRQGWPVSFVRGTRRTASGVVEHAWVELDGQVLPELNQPQYRARCQIDFVYPERDAP